MKRIRLQKILAEAGLFSRRKAEKAILEGRVRVNGESVTVLGASADPEKDTITCDGNEIKRRPKLYILLNKPGGLLTSCADDRGRRTVIDLVDEIEERLFPVGRLDYNTTGALILTNDGLFAQKMMRPSSSVTKTYLAKVRGAVSEKTVSRMRAGITVDGVRHRFQSVRLERSTGKNSVLKIELTEGKNRQIKKVCQALGCPVSKLGRIAYGPVKLGALSPGDYRHLSQREVKALLSGVKPKSVKSGKSIKNTGRKKK